MAKKLLFGVVMVLIWCAGASGYAQQYEIIQLTDNDYDDFEPRISGDAVVWHGGTEFSSGDTEIFFYDGTAVRQLTDNERTDIQPRVSGGNVVWRGFEGGSWPFFSYNGLTTTSLTGDIFNKIDHQVSGTTVVWAQHDLFSGGHFKEPFVDYDIYVSDGVTSAKLSNSEFYDRSPVAAGESVVWVSFDGTDDEIMFYNGSGVVRLTDNDSPDSQPHLDNGIVAWSGKDPDDADTEIFVYDGFEVTQLTENDADDSSPRVSGGMIAWTSVACDGEQEILFYDGTSIIPVTDDAVWDDFPDLSAALLAWQSDVDTDAEIFAYNSLGVTRLTQNSLHDAQPAVSGNSVVWMGYDGSDYEIFLASAVPEPFAALLFMIGFLPLARAGYRRRRA